jgi:hypothetical protein
MQTVRFLPALPILFALAAPGCAAGDDWSEDDDVEAYAAELRARGFEFRETLTGTYALEAGGERTFMSFSIRAESRDMERFRKDPVATITGEVTIPGLADRRPLEGTLRIDPLVSGKIEYRYAFVGDDGAAYAFAGDKNVELFRPFSTLTTLPGQVTDEAGDVVGRAQLKFDLRSQLGRWLKSIRLAF